MKILLFVSVIAIALAIFAGVITRRKPNTGHNPRSKKTRNALILPRPIQVQAKPEPEAPRTENPKQQRPQYQDKFWLMNKCEMTLYNRLTEAMPAMLVFSQVSMSQMLHIKGQTQLNEVGKKSIDFLVCRPFDTSIVAAIELNGPKHDTEERKYADEKKRQALQEAGIPLIVLKPDALPDVPALRKLLAPHIVERRKNEAERDKRLKRHPPTPST